jgi:hypothetical protein
LTLILTVNGPETIWVLADRRLSYNGRPPKDDARKVMFLETNDDGVAILGYAGLGATARGTEPADWMSAVLRGRNVPLEEALGKLADALKAQFPRHMLQIHKNFRAAHTVLIPAFLNGEARLYSIDLVFTPDRSSQMFRYTRFGVKNSTRAPRVAIAGSSEGCLAQNKNKWMRGLLRVVKACDRLQVSELEVADHLANLNNEVHLQDKFKLVGPRCLVAWRHRRGGVRNGGGGHQFYTSTVRDADSPALPHIATGMDVAALMAVMMPRWTERLNSLQTGQPPKDVDVDEINAALARLPETLGISGDAVRRRAARGRWARQPGNDGRMRIQVPDDVSPPRRGNVQEDTVTLVADINDRSGEGRPRDRRIERLGAAPADLAARPSGAGSPAARVTPPHRVNTIR